MAEESAKPPTITTPVGHMCTCEHPVRVSAGLRLRSTEGCCENAARALKMLASAALDMNAAGWQNAAWHQRERWRVWGNAGKSWWHVNVRALMAGWKQSSRALLWTRPIVRLVFLFCFHLCAFVFIYCFIIRVWFRLFWFYWFSSYSILISSVMEIENWFWLAAWQCWFVFSLFSLRALMVVRKVSVMLVL